MLLLCLIKMQLLIDDAELRFCWICEWSECIMYVGHIFRGRLGGELLTRLDWHVEEEASNLLRVVFLCHLFVKQVKSERVSLALHLQTNLFQDFWGYSQGDLPLCAFGRLCVSRNFTKQLFLLHYFISDTRNRALCLTLLSGSIWLRLFCPPVTECVCWELFITDCCRTAVHKDILLWGGSRHMAVRMEGWLSLLS